MVVRTAFSLGVEVAGADRLMMMHKVSIIQLAAGLVPERRSQPTPGVTLATHSTWFGGTYQDKPNQFAHVRRRSRAVLEAVPGVQGAARADEGVAGGPAGRDRRQGHGRRGTAGRSATRFRSRRHLAAEAGRRPGTSTSTASTTATRPSTRRSSSSSYDYFDENRRGGKGRSAGTSSRSTTRRTPREIAAKLDAQFANSSAETKTAHREGVRRRASRSRSATSARSSSPSSSAVLFIDPARARQHDGAVGARADERAGGAEDARLLERPRPGAGARRVAVHGARSAAGSASGWRALLVQPRQLQQRVPAGLRPDDARRSSLGVGSVRAARRRSPARCRRSAAMRLRITDALRRN